MALRRTSHRSISAWKLSSRPCLYSRSLSFAPRTISADENTPQSSSSRPRRQRSSSPLSPFFFFFFFFGASLFRGRKRNKKQHDSRHKRDFCETVCRVQRDFLFATKGATVCRGRGDGVCKSLSRPKNKTKRRQKSVPSGPFLGFRV